VPTPRSKSHPPMTKPVGQGHMIYTTAHPDAPDSIKDRNGEVCLALCVLCNRAEIELYDTPRCDMRSLFGRGKKAGK
jgi:hypothetical protein